jgi:hypothetical protein
MDPQVSASFIPKKPLEEVRGGAGASGLIFLLALLIFIASLVAAGALFLWSLPFDLARLKKASLEKYQASI